MLMVFTIRQDLFRLIILIQMCYYILLYDALYLETKISFLFKLFFDQPKLSLGIATYLYFLCIPCLSSVSLSRSRYRISGNFESETRKQLHLKIVRNYKILFQFSTILCIVFFLRFCQTFCQKYVAKFQRKHVH